MLKGKVAQCECIHAALQFSKNNNPAKMMKDCSITQNTVYVGLYIWHVDCLKKTHLNSQIKKVQNIEKCHVT